MAKTVKFNKKSFLLSSILLIIFTVLFIHYYINRKIKSINNGITNNNMIENKINFFRRQNDDYK